MSEVCKHIFSYEEGVDEAWLNHEPKHPSEFDSFDVIFKFCPLCGEELNLIDALTKSLLETCTAKVDAQLQKELIACLEVAELKHVAP